MLHFLNTYTGIATSMSSLHKIILKYTSLWPSGLDIYIYIYIRQIPRNHVITMTYIIRICVCVYAVGAYICVYACFATDNIPAQSVALGTHGNYMSHQEYCSDTVQIVGLVNFCEI